MKKIRQKSLFSLMLLLGVLCLGGCAAKQMQPADVIREEQEPDKAPEVFEGGGITLSIDYGFEKQVKSGRYMRVLADITNEGKDFTGNLQVVIPNQRPRRFMYQKEVSLAAGEKKRVEMTIPVRDTARRYLFALVDEADRVIAKKSVEAYISRSDAFFTGILTDAPQSMSYLSGSRIKPFYLEPENFPEDVLGLDSLDIIVINDFNTDTLNDRQYEALKAFVMKGGTLVLGTGAAGEKTLAAFDDGFLNSTTGTLKRKATSFGMDEESLAKIKNQLLEEALEVRNQEDAEKKTETPAVQADEINRLELNTVEKDILEIHLEGARPVVKEDGTVLLERLNIGRGNVLLSTMDLGLAFLFKDTIGMEIVNQIAGNISQDKLSQMVLEKEDYSYDYRRNNVVELIDEDKLPHVGKYAVILVLYLLVIGPPLYFILKKLDKRNLMWLLIPVFSVLFASLIYSVGDATRPDEPYIGFLTLKTVENGTAKEDTFFSVTMPYNDDYELDVSQVGAVVPSLYSSYYNGAAADAEEMDYNIAVKYAEDSTKIEIRDYPAFEPAYFEVARQDVTAGRVDSTLRLDDFRLTGEITNLLGYDLKQAALYAYGVVYILGDVKQGQTVSVDGKTGYKVMNPGDIYNDDSFLEKLSGGSPYGNAKEQKAETIRHYYTYEYFLTREAAAYGQGCYLTGFSQEDKTALDSIGLESSGVSMTVAAAEVDREKDKAVYIPKVDAYIQQITGSYDRVNRIIYEDGLHIDIQFESGDKITQLVYSAAMNGEFNEESAQRGDNWYNAGFYGEIRAYNYRTGNYDLVFTGGTEGSVLAEPYINEDNKMELLIEADQSRLNTYGQVNLPVLSAIKEGK